MIFNTLVSGGSSKLFKGLVGGSITEIKESDLKGVEEIRKNAFADCVNLTSVVIPASVTEIGDFAFFGCSNLKSVTLTSETPPTLGLSAFAETNAELVIYVPVQSAEAYRTAWGELADKIQYKYTEGLAYTLNDDDACYYVSGIGTATDTVVAIPASYSGLPVTQISAKAFYNNSKLTGIVIPDSVTIIGRDAFSGCSNLNMVSMGKGVISLGWSAFTACYKIKTVIYAGTIDQWAELDHAGSSNPLQYGEANLIINGEIITEVNLTTATKIADYAFGGYRNLTSVNIPNGVTSIGESAFSNCNKLTSIVIPESVTSISQLAFSNCYSLVEVVSRSTRITVIKGDTSQSHGQLGAYAFAVYNVNDTYQTKLSNDNGYIYYNDELEKILVAYIGNQTDLVLPAYITKINSYAFYEYYNLTSIIMPNSLTYVGYRAFDGCDSLQYNVKNDLKYLASNDNLYMYLREATTTGITTVTIDENCKIIGYKAFYRCNSLKSVVIPDSVTSIGNEAFYECKSLTDIDIPNSITTISNGMFEYCEKLTSVTIPENVTSIGGSAFYRCYALANINIPNSVKELGRSAFLMCRSLKSINIPDGVPLIAESTFYDCGLTSVNIPESVTSIEQSAFSGCKELTSIVIPENVTIVAKWAFSTCDKLTQVIFQGKPDSINEYAFDDATTDIYVPWAEGEVAKAPWGATNATIHYNSEV